MDKKNFYYFFKNFGITIVGATGICAIGLGGTFAANTLGFGTILSVLNPSALVITGVSASAGIAVAKTYHDIRKQQELDISQPKYQQRKVKPLSKSLEHEPSLQPQEPYEKYQPKPHTPSVTESHKLLGSKQDTDMRQTSDQPPLSTNTFYDHTKLKTLPSTSPSKTARQKGSSHDISQHSSD